MHDACRDLRRPLISASVQGLDGQLTTYKSYLGAPHPCLRCLFDDAMSDDALPSCAQGGVLGPVAGVIGTLQAVEVVKELTGIGVSLSGTCCSTTPRPRTSSVSPSRAGPDVPAAGPQRGPTEHCRHVEFSLGRVAYGYVKAKVPVAHAGPTAVSGAQPKRSGRAGLTLCRITLEDKRIDSRRSYAGRRRTDV